MLFVLAAWDEMEQRSALDVREAVVVTRVEVWTHRGHLRGYEPV